MSIQYYCDLCGVLCFDGKRMEFIFVPHRTTEDKYDRVCGQCCLKCFEAFKARLDKIRLG
jgi:hypothetical protein